MHCYGLWTTQVSRLPIILHTHFYYSLPPRITPHPTKKKPPSTSLPLVFVTIYNQCKSLPGTLCRWTVYELIALLQSLGHMPWAWRVISRVKICFHKSNLLMLLSLPSRARLNFTWQDSHRDPAGSITMWGTWLAIDWEVNSYRDSVVNRASKEVYTPVVSLSLLRVLHC